jgi:DNA-binding NarL/FixJ family response regulator
MKIKVGVLDDEIEVCNYLQTIINFQSDLICDSTFLDSHSAFDGIGKSEISVLLVDVNMPKVSGIEFISKAKPMFPQIQFIICSALEDNDTVFNALKAGANGYLLKSSSAEKICESIREVFNGGSPMSSTIARKVISSFHADGPKKPEMKLLTDREKEIIDLLAQGFRYKEIADRLFISIETVRRHISNVYEKLQVNSKTDAFNKLYY